MANTPEFHDESLMPIPIGLPFRVPDYAYPNWGIIYTNESVAVKAYKAEWEKGTAAQLALVSQASIRAFGDYPALLREQTARAVVELSSAHTESTTQPINLLDIGAGPGLSALAVREALPKKRKNRLSVKLIEPAAQALASAQSLMERYDITSKPLHGSDLEMLPQIETGSVDALIAVASVHHHARIPFDEYARVLRKDGYAIFADWHHDLWEHPARMLKFLERFDWPLKEEGLANWIKTYPQALENPDRNILLTPKEFRAREQITRFWLAYKEIADQTNVENNAIWPLEGHRPVSRYVEGLESAGFVVATPYKLLPDSSLLMITCARKIK